MSNTPPLARIPAPELRQRLVDARAAYREAQTAREVALIALDENPTEQAHAELEEATERRNAAREQIVDLDAALTLPIATVVGDHRTARIMHAEAQQDGRARFRVVTEPPAPWAQGDETLTTSQLAARFLADALARDEAGTIAETILASNPMGGTLADAARRIAHTPGAAVEFLPFHVR